ncbi:alginate lyase family protein [Bacteroidota bacterium]
MKKNVLISIILLVIASNCDNIDREKTNIHWSDVSRFITGVDSLRVIQEADEYLKISPVAIKESSCERSLGTIHDFYSEGDYWWPDTSLPEGPYIRKDGMSNPDNFKDHRIAMRNMSIWVASLTAAFIITGKKDYAEHAVKHLKTWFVDKETKMNPNMNYAQAIKGICPGRGVGLIDGIHLVEPARAVSILKDYGGISEADFRTIQKWYSEFLEWMTTHEYGIDERERKNNHGSAWVMQAAEYSRFTENEKIMQYCRDRFKNVLLPNQMGKDGDFPLELERTKPYGYSLFNIDILATVCHILSIPDDNLWTYNLKDGRGMSLGMRYIYPYIIDKSIWPLEPDVMYWDEWPVRHPALLFSGIEYKNNEYLELWKSLDPLPLSQEGLRNFPIRQPILWVN